MKGIYPHANTVVSIEDSKLLKRFQYETLYNAQSLPATLDELNKINYFHTYKYADIENYSAMLDGLMKDTFDRLRSLTPVETVWRMFALYYDIHNIKLAVKGRFTGENFDHLALDYGCYSQPTIHSAYVRASENILRNAALTEGYFEALNADDMYDIDFILDKTYFAVLKKMAGGLGIPGIAGFVDEKADLFNISAYYQSHAADAPEGYFAKAFSGAGSFSLEEWEHYTEGPAAIEDFPLWIKYRPILHVTDDEGDLFAYLDVMIDNYLIQKTKAAKLIAFGLEPICAYFFNKFMEIKNIRILLTGKKSNCETAEIRKRMRIPYEL